MNVLVKPFIYGICNKNKKFLPPSTILYLLPSLLLMAYTTFFEKFENMFCILCLFIYCYSMGLLVRTRSKP